jgi:hypothetical protein
MLPFPRRAHLCDRKMHAFVDAFGEAENQAQLRDSGSEGLK